MAELRCEDLAKSYGDRSVLAAVDLVVPEGTVTAILGASGSGKSTLLRLIMGFIRADRGRITVGGTLVAEAGRLHVAPEKRAVGYVAQEGALYPHLNVRNNVGFGLTRAERQRSHRVGEVLDLVGLPRDYADRRAHELSGGEQRRVALARALAPRPRLVLLDEPFSGLDAGLRVETREAVVGALAEEGTTAVLVTHDQAEALSVGREVAVLQDGRLVQTAGPAALYRTPLDLDVARFVGDAVVVPGHAHAGVVRCALGDLAALDAGAEGPILAMVRPEQIQPRPWRHAPGADATDGSEPTACESVATVLDRTYFGPDTLLRLALERPGGLVVVARTFSHDAPEAGERVVLTVSGPVVTYPPAPAIPDEAPGPAGPSGQGQRSR
jgi:iron(III) transport system ATP-binding protein